MFFKNKNKNHVIIRINRKRRKNICIQFQIFHDFPRHWVCQQYLPDLLADRCYYHYGDNKNEQAARRYWDEIKGPEA